MTDKKKPKNEETKETEEVLEEVEKEEFSFEDTLKKNAANKVRMKGAREGNNTSVTRSYRLKK